MQARVETLPTRHYVGLGTRFISILSPDSNSMVVLPELWDAFIHRLGEVSGIVGNATYGLCFTLGDNEGRTHDDELYYLACAEVGDPARVPAGMEVRTVDGGPHLIYTHRGPLRTLGDTLRCIHEEWAPASGYPLREAPHIEIYDDRFDPQSVESELDLGIPIRR